MKKLKHEKIIKDKILNHVNTGEMICNVQKQKNKQTKNNETKQQKRGTATLFPEDKTQNNQKKMEILFVPSDQSADYACLTVIWQFAPTGDTLFWKEVP